MASALQISPAEWDVMEIVWDTGPTTAAHVIARLSASHDWSHRTIRTLLARLVEKQALAFEVDGKAYIYRPAVTRLQCVRQESRSFMNKVFGGDVGALLVHFAEGADLDADELERLARTPGEKGPATEKRSMNAFMQSAPGLVWHASWQASLLAALVAVLIWLLGHRMAARWRYALWSIVLVRCLFAVDAG